MLGMIARPYAATLDAASDASQAAFPRDNMLLNDYGRVFRSVNGNVQTLIYYFDLGVAKPVDVIAVLWHNMRTGIDKISIDAGATTADAANGVLYNGSLIDCLTGVSQRDFSVPGKWLVTLTNPVTARYWALRIQTNTSVNPDGFMQISRVFIGKKALFQIGPQQVQLNAVDLNQKIQLETGEDRSSEDPLLIRPITQLDFRYAKESEMDDVLAQYTLGMGVSLPMMVVPDLTASNLQDTIVFGRPEQIVALQSDTYDVWQFQARVKSFGP